MDKKKGKKKLFKPMNEILTGKYVRRLEGVDLATGSSRKASECLGTMNNFGDSRKERKFGSSEKGNF